MGAGVRRSWLFLPPPAARAARLPQDCFPKLLCSWGPSQAGAAQLPLELLPLIPLQVGSLCGRRVWGPWAALHSTEIPSLRCHAGPRCADSQIPSRPCMRDLLCALGSKG
jgi:hypothetical protein